VINHKMNQAKLFRIATIIMVAAQIAAPAAHAYAGQCYSAAQHYRTDLNYAPPPVCWNSVWFRSTDGQHWDRPLPFGQDQGTRPPPAAPPADIPPPPPSEDDEPPPPGQQP
jgi:hypothetical protein